MLKVVVTKVPKKQTGGDIPETYGVPDGMGTAELERGEIYKDKEGGLQKIANDGNTHEEGGVEVDDAHKVLENTATMRNDFDSKALKMSPDEVKQVTGFEPDKGLSHSKALEKSWEYYEGILNKIQKKIKKNINDADQYNSRYAKNSMELNMEQLLNIPSKGELFDKLFAHQELTKQLAGIDKNQRRQQTGGTPAYATPEYQRSMLDRMDQEDDQLETLRNDKFALRPFDNVYRYYHNNFGYSGNPNDIGAWQKWISTNAKTNPRLLDYLHQVPLTNKGRKLYGDVDPNSLSSDQLINQFNDDLYDFRAPRFQAPAGPDLPYGPPKPASTPQFKAPVYNGPAPKQSTNIPGTNTPRPRTGQPQAGFNEPLNWYDVAGDLAALADSGRVPTRYNPVRLHEPEVHLLDARPELQAGQSNYNALLRTLPQNGVGLSNLGTIFAQKYGIDDKILGAYENENKQKLDQRDQIHANIRNQQEQMDQQSRENFERKYLGSLEAQRQQRMTSFNDLMDKIAQNHKLNREGNLMMKMFPNYDQSGNFTGNRGPIVSAPGQSVLQSGNNQTFTSQNPKTGQSETWMKTVVDGKPKLVRIA